MPCPLLISQALLHIPFTHYFPITGFYSYASYNLIYRCSSNSYKKEIIALIGMVGAYAIPFLIGTQSDNYTLLLSYIAIINIGILFICFFNQWENYDLFIFWIYLVYLSFLVWDISSSPTEFSLALFFSIVFFITFQS